jgi:hypothetical protein
MIFAVAIAFDLAASSDARHLTITTVAITTIAAPTTTPPSARLLTDQLPACALR